MMSTSTFKFSRITQLCFLYTFCAVIISASPLAAIPPQLSNSGGPDVGSVGPIGTVNPIGPNPIVSPSTTAATISNVIANTDIAPEVNVAPTIQIPYSVPYSVPVPVASGYPYPVPSCFSDGPWTGSDYGCSHDNCDFSSDCLFSHGHNSDCWDLGDSGDCWGSEDFGDCCC
ncbi:hypothetical protein BGZ49_002245 [Haplosporangium sp. Z 27]|nr:hypothetical protein BGZ49_002245 [Haplosporangium sp. Z 27]